MTTLADLHQAVHDALASGRLGTPVFVRYHGQATASTRLVPQLARMAAAARTWLAQDLRHIHALGSVAAGAVSVTLEFKGGATAVVSAATRTGRESLVDILVLGNRGALYHDAGHTLIGPKPPALPDQPPDPRLLAAIQKALRSGKVEPAGKAARP
jgi:predicted dehydrogenase